MKRLILPEILSVIALVLLMGKGATGLHSQLNISAAPNLATIRYVATTGSDSANDCSDSLSPCATIQHATDVSSANDEIRVASGTYTDVHGRQKMDIAATGLVTQVVYLSQTLTLRGGFSPSDWTTPHAGVNLTILDAQTLGRVIYITGNISPTITGFSLTNGNAAGLGGSLYTASGASVYVITASAVISENIIDHNGQVGFTHVGGGIFLQNSHSTLNGNRISNNTAGGGGGIMAEASSVTIDGNSIYNNVAQSGFGGGLALESFSGTAIVNGNIISGNQAATGGGIETYFGGSLTISGNRIVSNTAKFGGTGIGGGLRIFLGYPILVNNVIADNFADGSGSAVYLDRAFPSFSYTTIARNRGGDGSAIYVTNNSGSFSQPSFVNTILFSQTVAITTTTLTNTVTLDGVLWSGNGLNTGGPGQFIVTHAYTGSAAFAADGYHLTAASAAIDRGVSTAVTTDIDGQPRPMGRASDLGADEFVPQIFLPLVLKNF